MKEICTSFPFRLNSQGGVASVDVGTIQHLEENITQILTTRKGERAMLPNYGCGIEYSMFENIETPLYNILIREIIENISEFEPNVVVNDDDLTITAEDNTVYVTMNYRIKVDGSFHNYELQL